MGLRSAPPAASPPPPHFMGRRFFNPTRFPTQLQKNEAAPAADTASTGKPPGDTLLVSAPLYGRCLLKRPTFARTVGGPGRRTNYLHLATIRGQCQGG